MAIKPIGLLARKAARHYIFYTYIPFIFSFVKIKPQKARTRRKNKGWLQRTAS
jgi:hypothetical protein